MMIVKPIAKQRRNTGARAFIPSWLSDPDGTAPCICGMPMVAGQPYIVAEGELGFKRWFHAPCWSMIMEDMDDEMEGMEERDEDEGE